MQFRELLDLVGNKPAFESSLLLAGSARPSYLQRQLSGWVDEGKLIQLRRGLYVLAPAYRKVDPHPFLLANLIRRGSYVSLQSVLDHAGLIPEHVPAVTSVWAGRPGEVHTPIGRFLFRHIKVDLLYGYAIREVQREQEALVADPEKALLDLDHLTAGGDDPRFLRELRLHDIDALQKERLRAYAGRAGSPKLERAAELVSTWIQKGEVPE